MRKAVVCLVLALSLLFSLSGFVVAQDDVVELWYMGWAWPGDQPQEPRLDGGDVSKHYRYL